MFRSSSRGAGGQGERLFLLLLPQHHADLAQRAARLRDLQPVPARLVDGWVTISTNVAVLERHFQGDHPAVHLRADALVPDLAVDRVREVDRRGSPGQLLDVAPRREDVHLLGEQLDLDGVQELAGSFMSAAARGSAQPENIWSPSRRPASLLVFPVAPPRSRRERASPPVRIWISIISEFGPKTVVWSDW